MSLPAMVIVLPRSNVRSNGALLLLQKNNNLSNGTDQHHSFLKFHASLTHKNVLHQPAVQVTVDSMWRIQVSRGGGGYQPF